MIDNKREGSDFVQTSEEITLVFISYSVINIYDFFLLGEVRLFLINGRD